METVQITIKPNNKKWGLVTITQEDGKALEPTKPEGSIYKVAKGTLVKIEATASDNFRFICWSDGVNVATRNLCVTEDMKFIAIFSSKSYGIQELYMSLLGYQQPSRIKHQDCPTLMSQPELKPVIDTKEGTDLIQDYACKPKNSCCIRAWKWLLPVVLIIVSAVFFFFICSCSVIGDTSISSDAKTANINTNLSNSGNNSFSIDFDFNKQTTTITKVIKDTLYLNDTSSSMTIPLNVTVNCKPHYSQTEWDKYLYRILLALIFATLIVLSIKYIIPYYMKQAEHENKMNEQRYRDYVRILDENRDYNRMASKAAIQLWERQEKLRLDEWQRDNEHDRKLEIMEQERIAELSDVFIELAKIKNTATFSTPNGKEVEIERSILSDDCCEQLQKIIQGYMEQGNDCCTQIMSALKCLLGNSLNYNNVKKVLKCLLNILCNCNKNDKSKDADVIAAIEKLIAVLQTSPSSGLQQVVNISGNDKDTSTK